MRLRPLALFILATLAASSACGVTVNVGEPPPEKADDPARPPRADLSPPTPSPASSLDWNGAWEWLTPQLTTQVLHGAWSASESDTWLVGDHGAVLRWDGKTRAKVEYQGSFDATYRAVAGTSLEDVWIGGDHAALHFNGTSWTSSLALARYDVLAIVNSGPSIFAVTKEEIGLFVVPGRTPYELSGVLDVVAARSGGFYALKRDGVHFVDKTFTSGKPIVTFTNADPAKMQRGMLLGDEEGSLRYLFVSLSSNSARYAFYDNPNLTRAAWDTSSTIYEYLTNDQGFVGRVDASRIFLRPINKRILSYYDGTAWGTTALDQYDPPNGSLRLPSGEAAIFGSVGVISSASPVAQGKFQLTPRTADGARADMFAVAPDSSAWTLRSTFVHDRWYPDTLGVWDDEIGWQWSSIPDRTSQHTFTMAMTPLSRSSVWLSLRTSELDNPKYYGGDTLAHWNGTRFDVLRDAPKSIRVLAADREGGFFALATDGTLMHAKDGEELRPLGDAGTSGEDSYQLCTPRIAPVSGERAWVVDSVCQVSFWDGATMRPKPTFRAPIHATGWIDFMIWASGPDSLWVADPSRGLVHYDGTRWEIVWRSELGVNGIWGADDNHVWFLDSVYNIDRAAPSLRMWDGHAVQTIASTPGGWFLAGGNDTAWLGGDLALLRLRARRTGGVR